MDGLSPEAEFFDKDVAEEIAEILRNREETIATAESATGGLVGSLLTNVPGASEYFDRAVVTYSESAKQQLAGVDKETLVEKSAVSEEAARQMAKGVRDLAQTDWGLSITGYAGPTNGDEDPIGTVYIGVAYAGDEENKPFSKVSKYRFEDGRTTIKGKFARNALGDLEKQIKSLG